MANEPLKIQQSLLESSSETNELPCIANEHSRSSVIKYRYWEKLSCSKFFSDEEFQLTEPLSAEILGQLVEEAQKCSTLVP